MSDQRKMNESSLSPQQWHDENLRLADELEAFANDKLRAGFAVFGPTKLRALAAHLRTRPSETADEAGEPDGFEYGFEVYEVRGDDRLQVAAGFGPDAQSMREEANHYAAQYAQDGPVEVFLTTRWPLSPALADGHAGVEFTATLPVAQGEQMQAIGDGPNPYYEGNFEGETDDLARLRRRLVSERDAARATAPKLRELSDGEIAKLGHRHAWRYRHADHHGASVYEFRLFTLVGFARAVLAAAGKEKP
jgi:hypothetical protein